MERETMAYSLNQNVIIFGNTGGRLTGKITGDYGDSFIVTLDHPLQDGTTTVLWLSSAVRPIACHWCQDAKKVSVSSFTMAQASDSIPTVDCPYCKE